MSSKALTAIAAVFAALCGLFAASWWFQPQQVQLKSGTLLPQARQIADFTLTDQDGKPFTKTQLSGHWTLLFPGFTHCPDVCPTTLAFLKQLHSKLAAENKPVSVVFLSVDPERDQPKQLASYVHYFNPSFTGVTAGEPELGRFAQGLGIAYAKVPGKTADTYSMDHSAAMVLINPRAQIAGYFTPPHTLDAMSADLAAVMENSR